VGRMELREERTGDERSIAALHTQAFPSAEEAQLVERLREACAICASMVAITEGRVVGHALYSRAHIVFEDRAVEIAALGPVAVLPGLQRQGIGATIVKQGLERCWQQRFAAVIVLGNPKYYGRFGFGRADAWEITCELAVPVEAFLIAWANAPRRGPAIAKYHPAFAV